MTTTTESIHIVSTPDVLGGKPRIKGHRIAVHDVAIWHQQGMSPASMAEDYGLTLGEVYAALSYYYDHQPEIDQQLTQEDEEFRKLAREDQSPAARRLRQALQEAPELPPRD